MIEQDNCPNNDSGDHRYFIFKTQEVYVPFAGPWKPGTKIPTVDLFTRIEQAVLGCNCGSVIKKEVRA